MPRRSGEGGRKGVVQNSAFLGDTRRAETAGVDQCGHGIHEERTFSKFYALISVEAHR